MLYFRQKNVHSLLLISMVFLGIRCVPVQLPSQDQLVQLQDSKTATRSPATTTSSGGSTSTSTVSNVTSTPFEKFKNVINNNCLACHNNSLNGNFALLVTEKDWLLSGYIIPKDPTNSPLYASLKSYGTNGTMPKNLPALSSANAKDIYDWILGASAIGSDFGGANLKISNRHYVNSVISYVFGNSLTYYTFNTYPTYSEALILRNPTHFQGSCDLYSVVQNDAKRIDNSQYPPLDPKDDICYFGISNLSNGNTSSVRHGYLTQVCEKYAADAASITYAMKTHHGWTTGDLVVNDDNLQKAYDAWYPERTIPDPFKASLFEVATTTNVNKDKWKWIYLTLCLSAEWQAP